MKFENFKVVCDFCNVGKPTASVKFGTTQYTRFICEKCKKKMDEQLRKLKK